ncbi:MAG: CHAD domain-containing protein [marine benthic group bacterium]|nr:CHAD domain-containing protein [Candidatus Benthicola marisminoris]
MARRPSSLLDLPAYAGAIRIARFYLDRAGQAAARLKKKGDEKALHDFRVSLRRLRSTLQAYAPYLAPAVSPKQRRKIRRVASGTGGGRDAEVQLAWLEGRQLDVTIDEAAGVELVREKLEDQLAAGYGNAVSGALRKFAKLDRRLRRRLDDLETTAKASGLDEGRRFSAAVALVLPDYAAELDLHLSRVHSIADEGEAHRARIRGKRLRYVLEPIADDVEGVDDLLEKLKGLQDVLGDLRDAQLLSRFVTDLEREAGPGPRASAAPGLRRLAELLDQEQHDLFERLRETWLGTRSADFFATIEGVREYLVATGSADIEIERKYLLSGLPPALAGRDSRCIEQGYIPGERLHERVRRVRQGSDEWYVRTVKVGSGIRRIELQEDTDRGTFEVLWPLTRGRRVIKRRYRVPEGSLTWEVDEFTDRELVLAEVELPSEDVKPKLPDWLAPYVVREVTDEPEYVNINLAR